MGLLTPHFELGEVVKLIIVLSHGEVQAESGMSASVKTFTENISEGVVTTQKWFMMTILEEI